MKAFALTMVAMPPRCTGSPVRSGEPPQWCSRVVGHARKGAAAGSLSTRNRAATLAVLVVATSGRIVESAMRNRDVPTAPIWKIARAIRKTDPKRYYACLGVEPFLSLAATLARIAELAASTSAAFVIVGKVMV